MCKGNKKNIDRGNFKLIYNGKKYKKWLKNDYNNLIVKLLSFLLN